MHNNNQNHGSDVKILHCIKCEWHTAQQQLLQLCLITLMAIKKDIKNVSQPGKASYFWEHSQTSITSIQCYRSMKNAGNYKRLKVEQPEMRISTDR